MRQVYDVAMLTYMAPSIMEVLVFLDITSTYIVPLKTNDKENNWAMVFGWGSDEPTSSLYGKIAYQPKNSLMQDYNIDWLMPINDNGEVDDTEISIVTTADIDYLTKQWKRIKKERKL